MEIIEEILQCNFSHN